MKKAALLIGLMVFSAVAGGSFAYGWHSVTNGSSARQTDRIVVAPAAAERAVASTSNSPSSEADAQSSPLNHGSSELSINQPLSSIVGEKGQISLTLDQLQLSQLVNDALLSQPQAAQLLANAQSLQTILKGDRIETGAVLNLAELPRDGLSDELQAGLDQLMQAVPMLTNRDIYIGVIARPQVQDGQISLDQDLGLRIGQFTLPLADVAEQLGFSTHEIEQRLNDLLNQQGLTLDNIEILNEQLVITGMKP
ncbi:hypothetical protein N836_35990 [Leptolyngbya sp. Heron Island J]|uniref:hypothetical protein n=1 Tax=Leptolyngbya sp. Heron Island J TaxID=1385935 RepID=UPI0003B97047|nr:hypothetical protein [Leptolyngbya sp. Heron Island J]ESA37570.1 hypothetical protein N836_35990 [Leptolyngbya sp. Heron Island J]